MLSISILLALVAALPVSAARLGASADALTYTTVNLPENWLILNPTCHHTNPKLMKLAKQFVEDDPKFGNVWMFYLWGHSYEFDHNDNWDVIENLAEYIGGREDIWYATNIEIYNYVKAYERLQTSIDKSIIHNPTDTDIWVFAHNQTIRINAGETFNISSL